MRSDIFIEWLNNLDYYFRTMNKKVLLLIDNTGSHFNPKRFKQDDDDNDINNKEIINESNSEQESSQNYNNKKVKKNNVKKKGPKLTNIELVYLPLNITSHLQPMDAGIIHSFKAKYKREFCNHLIRQFDSGDDYLK